LIAQLFYFTVSLLYLISHCSPNEYAVFITHSSRSCGRGVTVHLSEGSLVQISE